MQSEVYEEISVEDSTKLCAEQYKHAAHVMLYAEYPGAFMGKYPYKYAIMMQMRFDGTLGFPGGILDEGETPHHAATRELAEEVGGVVTVEAGDHVTTSCSPKTGLCLHFFAKQVSLTVLKEMEEGATNSPDWGHEVLGVLRCPLYTLPNGLGFPAFLNNYFIGNTRSQLLTAVSRCGLLTEQEVKVAIETSQKVNSVVNKDEIDY